MTLACRQKYDNSLVRGPRKLQSFDGSQSQNSVGLLIVFLLPKVSHVDIRQGLTRNPIFVFDGVQFEVSRRLGDGEANEGAAKLRAREIWQI